MAANQFLEFSVLAGGCGYATSSPGTDDNGTQFRVMEVAYFNLGEPQRPTVADLQQWARSAGGTDTGSSWELPDTFSMWQGATLTFKSSADEWGNRTAIPEYTQGASAIAYFLLHEDDALTVLAAPNADRTGTDSETGATLADISEALAAGETYPYSGTFDVEDGEGYTTTFAVAGRVDPFTADLASSRPGEFEAVSTATARASVTNTTVGRNAPTAEFQVLLAYPADSPICATIGAPIEDRACVASLASFPESDVGVDGQVSLTDQSGATQASASFAIDNLAEYAGLQQGSALDSLYQPVGIYIRLDDDRDATSATGCLVTGFSGSRWYVPLAGQADPICS